MARWRLTSGLSLHLRDWDDEYALYNNLTGDTHLLGAPAIHILRALQHTARSEDELAVALAAAFDVDEDQDLATEIADLLAHLKSLSLVEAA